MSHPKARNTLAASISTHTAVYAGATESVTRPPTRLVIVPAITMLRRSPAARVSDATVAISVPLTTVLAVPDNDTVPVSNDVPEPGAVVPVHFSICSVPEVEAVEKTALTPLNRQARVATKTVRVASV